MAFPYENRTTQVRVPRSSFDASSSPPNLRLSRRVAVFYTFSTILCLVLASRLSCVVSKLKTCASNACRWWTCFRIGLLPAEGPMAWFREPWASADLNPGSCNTSVQYQCRNSRHDGLLSVLRSLLSSCVVLYSDCV